MKFRRHGIVFAKNENKPGETDVPQGLAYTPAEMLTKTQRGSSISLDSLAPYAEYDNDASFRMDFDNMRGVDQNDCWEISQSSSKSLAHFRHGLSDEMKRRSS